MRFFRITCLHVLLLGVITACGSSSRFNSITVPCTKPPSEVLRNTRDYLLLFGFEQRSYNPDSGYYRTSAKKVQTVSQISSHAPLWYTVEIRCHDNVVEVAGYSLIYGRNSQAIQFGASPEFESQTEEEGIIPGSRAYGYLIMPLVEHIKDYCDHQ
jgi:hypothetical protein